MMASLNAFSAGWAVALVFFGIHLILIGYLAWKSGYIPKLVGILLVIAGLGYAADSFIGFLVPDYVTPRPCSRSSANSYSRSGWSSEAKRFRTPPTPAPADRTVTT